jgi:hypothetical protein
MRTKLTGDFHGLVHRPRLMTTSMRAPAFANVPALAAW